MFPMFDSIQQRAAGFDTLALVTDKRLSPLLFGAYLGVVIAVVGGAAVMPQLFFGYPHRGISFWGNYFPALIPYSAGLLISAITLAYAAFIMPGYPERLGILRLLMWSISAGLVLVLLTPEQANALFYWLHTLAAVYLFLVAGIGSVWIMLHGGKTLVDWAFFGLVVLGSLMSLFSASYVRMMGVLALGQVLALNGAMLIVVRAALRWSVQEVKE